MKINEILKDSNYKLTQFSETQIQNLENQVIEKESKGKITYKVVCLVRKKEVLLTPEEVVRQLYLMVLTEQYQYPVKLLGLEYPIASGRETKRADIVVFEKDRTNIPYIIVEVKQPKEKDKDNNGQLKSYCQNSGALMGIWTNGEYAEYYHSYKKSEDRSHTFEPLNEIPTFHQTLSEIKNRPFYYKDLLETSEKKIRHKTLLKVVKQMYEDTLARAGVDMFEEAFKLFFAKIFDEVQGYSNPSYVLHFRKYDTLTAKELHDRINSLFKLAKEKWEDVFLKDDKIEIPPSAIGISVAHLQDYKLLNSNLDLVDDAFEYLFSESQKSDKGQYFTPRYVIDMCVKMLNPKKEETVIDTAAGSSGFTVHSIFHVWQQILKEQNINASHLFTAAPKNEDCVNYVRNKVFAIEYDKKVVKVARCLNIIAGDGETNVLKLNSLYYPEWDDNAKDEEWRDTYGKGWKKFKELAREKGNWKYFDFDVLMANPPFAGDRDEYEIIELYQGLGQKDGKSVKNIGRDVLFIERNLNMLKDGGRMAVVLPQGRFNNSSDKHIREFIAENCRILAVIGLHPNTFQPHTGTKTSVLLVQKWTNDKGINPRKEDYPVFFATQQKPAKDVSGEKLFLRNENKELRLDEQGHPTIDHDLFSITLENGTSTPEGIAEAFIEFAKKEKLSFYL